MTTFADFTENVTLELPPVHDRLMEFAESATDGFGLVVEVAAIHEGLTANFNYYPAQELERAIESWTQPFPKPILLNHDLYVDPVGRVMSASMDVEADGSKFTRLQFAVTSPEAIAKVLDQRYLTGSVGGKSEESLCSVCGRDWTEASVASMPCSHVRGRTYKGKLAFLERKILSFHEYSFVNTPADKRSMIKSVSTSAGNAEEGQDLDRLRIFNLNMNSPQIVEFTEGSDRDVLSSLRKKEATPLYHQLKGSFLSALAVEQDNDGQETEVEENEDILSVVDQLSEDLSEPAVAEEEEEITSAETTDGAEEAADDEEEAADEIGSDETEEEADDQEASEEADEIAAEDEVDADAEETVDDEEADSDDEEEEAVAADEDDEEEIAAEESELLDGDLEEDEDDLEADEAEKSFSPPEGVRAAAARGLELRQQYNRGGTAIGVARARDLSNGKGISMSTIKRMVSYFARHEVDKKGQGWKEGSTGYPSAGRIAWLLWGGDAGQAWANKIARQAENGTANASEEAEAQGQERTRTADAYDGFNKPDTKRPKATKRDTDKSRESDDSGAEIEEGEVYEAQVDVAELIATVDRLESRVAELEASEASLLEKNTRLQGALHRTLAERVVDTKIALGVAKAEEREELLEDHATRSASSLADSLRDLAAMPRTAPTMPEPIERKDMIIAGDEPVVEGEQVEENENINPEDFLVDVLMGRKRI